MNLGGIDLSVVLKSWNYMPLGRDMVPRMHPHLKGKRKMGWPLKKTEKERKGEESQGYLV